MTDKSKTVPTAIELRDDRDPTAPPRWLPPVILLLLVAWPAFRESGALDVGDIFWHLRTGDLILDDGPPRMDLFSWTVSGEQWRPNAWLGDAVWAGMRSLAGPAGISLLAGATVVAVALLLYRSGRRNGAGPWASVAAATLAITFLAPFVAPRPLLFGFVLLPVTLGYVARYRAGDRKALIWIAVLVALWSNLHGSYVVGVGIIGLGALGWAVDRRTLAKPAALASAAGIAGLLNPYGVFSYLQALQNRAESGTIEEWQPLALDDARGISLVVFMLLVAAVLWRSWSSRRARQGDGESRWPTDWHTVLPLALLAAATFWSIRMGSFLLIVAAPVLALGFSRLKAPGLRAWAAERTLALVTGLAVAGVILAWQAAPELTHAGDLGAPFQESIVAAIPADCRLLNEYDLGGFIIDRRWPEVLVSQDGRADLYGLEELRRQERWLNSSDVGPIEAAGVECVLTERDRSLAGALIDDPGWEQRAQTSRLVLMVKNRGFD